MLHELELEQATPCSSESAVFSACPFHGSVCLQFASERVCHSAGVEESAVELLL